MNIGSYEFGRVEVGGEIYTADIIILPSAVIIEQWWRRSGHELCLTDINAVLDAEVDIEVLVVGIGANGMVRVLPEVKKRLSEKGIELIAENTEKACKTYNELAGTKKTAAALHLTC